MSIESFIGILSGLIAIGTAAIALYKWIKRNQLAEISELMKRLADSKLSNNQHKKILRQIKRKLTFLILLNLLACMRLVDAVL